MQRRIWHIVAFLLLPWTLQATTSPYFEAACLNKLVGPHNTLLFLELQPTLMHIEEGTGTLLADVNIRIGFREESSKRILVEKNLNEKITHDFLAGGNAFFKEYAFALPDGSYEVSLEVRDRISGRTHLALLSYDCNPLGKAIGLSDITLTQEFGGVLTPQPLLGDHVKANPERLTFRVDVYAPQATLLTARAILYQRRPGNRRQGDDADRLNVSHYASLSQLNEIIPAAKGVTVYTDHISLKDLPHGEYLLEVFLYQDEKLIAEKNRKFLIDWKHMKDVFGDLNQAIDMMVHIASDDVRASLQAITDTDAKQEAFRDFWRRRSDPNRESGLEALERYYERIFYAIDNFAEDRPGWKTDRGRTYVLYGPPDTKGSLEIGGDIYEAWSYERWNLKFLFHHEESRLRLVKDLNNSDRD